MEFITKSANQTQDLGQRLGASLIGGEVFALEGDLGSGKTTFIQGLAKGAGITQRVISPTFIVMRQYSLPKFTFYHVDLYRLEGDLNKEIENLGLKNMIGGNNSVMVIEWAERIKELLPRQTKWIKFENLGEDKRKIIYETQN